MVGMALPRDETGIEQPQRGAGSGSAEVAFPYVDSRASASLSFGTHRAAQPPFSGQTPVPVGPGRTPQASPPDRAGEGVSEFPLQAAKVQRPALRAETLQRDRLLDWLSSQAESKVILITAEAGYGKTTLLADFSRRTRRRVLWYRIDENDRSWVSLVRYLVAAGQEVDPEFGTETRRLLERLGSPEAPTRAAIVAQLVADFGTLTPSGGAILILDDYHQIDDVAEIREVLNDFVSHAADRLTIVFAGRRPPSLSFARLRSTGSVAELRTDDLRFDLAESDRLFRETYGRNLDQDLLADVARHTDGWAACLQLVQSALRNRSSADTREFIAGLTGAAGDLHDYLAEEVVGDLDTPAQLFLMRTSLLQSVYPKLAAVICEIDDLEAGRQVAEAERVGLLSRRSDTHGGGRRYHPLVQEFLEARLRRDFGDDEVVRLHRMIARYAAPTDWRLAAHHFAAAGDIDDLHRLVEASVPSIMAGGEFAIAESFIDRLPDGRTRPIFEIVLSRMELTRDRPAEAVRLAESAVAAQRSTGPSAMLDQSLANLLSVYYQVGQIEEAIVIGGELSNLGRSEPLVAIGRAWVQLMQASVDGPLQAPLDLLRQMSEIHYQSGDLHYFGITQINIGEVERAAGNPEKTRRAAEAAIAALSASSASHEIGAARLLLAWALAHAYQMIEAQDEIDLALQMSSKLVLNEARFEAASILLAYGDPQRAGDLLEVVGPLDSLPRDLQDQYPATLAELEIRRGQYGRARQRLESIDSDRPHRDIAFKARVLTLRAFAAVLAQDEDAPSLVLAALDLAELQGAARASVQAEMLLGALGGDQQLESVLKRHGDAVGPWVSTMAELFVNLAFDESEFTRAIMEQEAHARPERWRQPLRTAIELGARRSRARAASLLELVGQTHDVRRLREFAKQSKGAAFVGRGLARRVADRARIADLGRVSILVGNRSVGGETVRRKVLALLCYLITRPGMAAARDQVVDALWPDQDPVAAANSLNQTVYFLRRVFEPRYVDDLSPGYLRHETDLIWLDSELISSDSDACRNAIEAARKSSSRASVDLVSRGYSGRFALDFRMWNWAFGTRATLQPPSLALFERGLGEKAPPTRFDRELNFGRVRCMGLLVGRLKKGSLGGSDGPPLPPRRRGTTPPRCPPDGPASPEERRPARGFLAASGRRPGSGAGWVRIGNVTY